MTEDLDLTGEQTASILAVTAALLRFPSTCDRTIIRGGKFEACKNTAVAVARETLDDEDKLVFYPVCAFHTHAGLAVPLTELISLLSEGCA